MRHILLIFLPLLLPLAAAWARREEANAIETGFPLDEQGLSDAAAVGVLHPEKIRILLVDAIPTPSNPILKLSAAATGLLSPLTGGLSLRYGILIRKDCCPDRHMVAHECVHTAQYERLGGIKPFLKQYLTECIVIGYPEAPLEQEAIEKQSQLLD